MYPVILSGPIATAVVPVPAGMKLISINIMLSRMETVAASPQHDVRNTFWFANEIEGARRKPRVARASGMMGFPERTAHKISSREAATFYIRDDGSFGINIESTAPGTHHDGAMRFCSHAFAQVPKKTPPDKRSFYRTAKTVPWIFSNNNCAAIELGQLEAGELFPVIGLQILQDLDSQGLAK